MPTPEVRVLGAGPHVRIRILQRLRLGAEVEIGKGLKPAGHGLCPLSLPRLDLIRDVLCELLRQVVRGIVFADVLDGVVEAQGFTVTHCRRASERTPARSGRPTPGRERPAWRQPRRW